MKITGVNYKAGNYGDLWWGTAIDGRR